MKRISSLIHDERVQSTAVVTLMLTAIVTLAVLYF